MKSLCEFCGWEIKNADWYNYYNQQPICNNCLMDNATEQEKERANY